MLSTDWLEVKDQELHASLARLEDLKAQSETKNLGLIYDRRIELSACNDFQCEEIAGSLRGGD